MHALKVKLSPSQNREVIVRLPNDFPEGEVEVIVLSDGSHQLANIPTANAAVSAEFATRFPHAGTLGPIVYHEDPRLPLAPEDWGEDCR